MPLSHFTAKDWLKIDPKERVAQCRRMVKEATELANNATGETRTAYLDLARNWAHLADEMERANSK